MNEQSDGTHRVTITTQTGVSIGAIVIFIGLVVWVMNGIASINTKLIIINTEITSTQTQNATSKAELIAKIEAVNSDVAALKSSKSGVTAIQFFQWAVHLQQSNPQMKVPEPEITK